MPSVVAMSRGGSGTPSSPLLPLLLPLPGPHNKAAAAAGRAASARARAPAASTQPPPPVPPLGVAGPGADGAGRLRRAVLGGAGADSGIGRFLLHPPSCLSEPGLAAAAATRRLRGAGSRRGGRKGGRGRGQE